MQLKVNLPFLLTYRNIPSIVYTHRETCWCCVWSDWFYQLQQPTLVRALILFRYKLIAVGIKFTFDTIYFNDKTGVERIYCNTAIVLNLLFTPKLFNISEEAETTPFTKNWYTHASTYAWSIPGEVIKEGQKSGSGMFQISNSEV